MTFKDYREIRGSVSRKRRRTERRISAGKKDNDCGGDNSLPSWRMENSNEDTRQIAI